MKTWLTNALIGLLLGLMLIQTLPGVPQWLSWRPQAIADALGVWQFRWSMFTPETDDENHRFRATITYEDGRVAHWESPRLREQNAWQRFWGHRRSEYLDEVQQPFYSLAWPGLADWLARTHREDPSDAGRPRRVEIYLDTTKIRDPRFPRSGGWTARPTPGVYESQLLLHEEDYP